jgi:A/G-specific adenine glycosylase
VPAPSSVPAPAHSAILAWYAERGRQLAFRRTRDPYAVLVSESMAQQTQAARAAEYWERFMARFPTVEALAAATPADVLRAWQGLGYDRRALALWRTARIVVDQMDGRIPSAVTELEKLPGIGPYTARAVAAIAFGIPVGAVDVNVRRVLGRIAGADPAALGAPAMQRLADESVSTDRAADWTHAVMDIGATLCRPRAPRCEACPAQPWCRYASAATGRSKRGGASAATSTDGAARSPGTSAATLPRARRKPATPFPSTNRWLRGRILDRLRAAPDGEWVQLDGSIGVHDLGRVLAAANAMAADGVVELGPDDPGAGIRARLPLA